MSLIHCSITTLILFYYLWLAIKDDDVILISFLGGDHIINVNFIRVLIYTR